MSSNASKRALILPTAMFIVMMVLVSITVGVVRHRNRAGLSRWSDGRLQHAAAAQGGIEWGLAELARPGSTFAQDHLGASRAYSLTLGEHSLTVWLEEVADRPGDYELVCQGSPTEVRRARLHRMGEVEGAVYTRSQIGSENFMSANGPQQRGLFTLYTKSASAADWTPLAPPPDLIYGEDPSTSTRTRETFARGINALVGDSRGGLYLVDKREDGANDPLGSVSDDSLWYRPPGSSWQLLEPPPAGAYSNAAAATLTPEPGYGKRLVQLAYGDDSLYAVSKKADDVDVIWQRKGDQWRALPNTSKDPSELCVDEQGSVYCTIRNGLNQSILTSTPDSQGNHTAWTSRNLPPWNWTEPEDRGTELAVSPQGDLYCLRRREKSASNPQPDELYTWSGGGWQVLNSPEGHMTNLTVDSKGNLYISSPREGDPDPPDVIHRYDPVSQSWTTLPTQKHATVALDGTVQSDPNRATSRSLDLSGGGAEAASGQGQFREIWTYSP